MPDGDPLYVIGMKSIPLCIGEQSVRHPVIIAGLGDLGGILGIDFLSKNIAQGVLRSQNFNVDLHKNKSLSATCARVHLTETVHMPPNSEIFLQGEIRGNFFKDQEGYIEPLDEFRGSNDLLMPKSVIRTSNSNVVMSVLNPTPERKILRKNVQVASIFPVDNVTSCDFQEPTETPVSSEGNCIPEHLRPLVENVSNKFN